MRVSLLLIIGCIYAGTALPQKSISLSDEDYETTIIDGSEAKRYQFPYMVSIWHEIEHDRVYRCGGVIISESWLLSTARCISVILVGPGEVPIPLRLLAVAGTLGLVEGNEERQTSRIERPIHHPNWNGAVNDIALGKLMHPLRFTPSVRPVQLPKLGAFLPAKAVVSGWGRKAEGISGHVLQYLEVTLITNEECNNILTNLSGPGTYPYIVRKDRLCALPENAGESVCFGDFGGPLVQNNTLVGIVNGIAGASCNQRPKDKPYPNIFAKVSSAINFIKLYAEL